MAKTDNPLGPLSRIGKRLRKTAQSVGLDLKAFTIAPDLDAEEGPHHAQAVFTFDENFVPDPPKDDEWEKFENEKAKQAEKERIEAAKAGLGDLIEKLDKGPSDGIL